MTVTIYESTKFNHSREQYYAVAGHHTLLRLTCGGIGGQSGGAIKTATASDDGAAPVYFDRDALIAALTIGVQNLGGRSEDVVTDRDGKGRCFASINLAGNREDLLDAFKQLAEQIEKILDRKINRDTGYNDMRDLYNDLCHTVGEPVYLSDGVYLGSEGHMFE